MALSQKSVVKAEVRPLHLIYLLWNMEDGNGTNQ